MPGVWWNLYTCPFIPTQSSWENSHTEIRTRPVGLYEPQRRVSLVAGKRTLLAARKSFDRQEVGQFSWIWNYLIHPSEPSRAQCVVAAVDNAAEFYL